MNEADVSDPATTRWAKAFARRNLVRLSHYIDATGSAESIPRYAEDLPLDQGEMLLGIYENSPGVRSECIAVTDLGLYIVGDTAWMRIRYSDIGQVELVLPDDIELPKRKLSADRVTIHLLDGQVIALPVRGIFEHQLEGGVAETRDAYLVYNFLRRTVYETRQGQAQQGKRT